MSKPTKPGFYWYKAVDDYWRPVECVADGLSGFLAVWRMGWSKAKRVEDLDGEWGPEIVHAD